MDRFSGTPETRMVKCSNCKENMEYLTDGESLPSFVENGHRFPEVHICWDCLDSIPYDNHNEEEVQW